MRVMLTLLVLALAGCGAGDTSADDTSADGADTEATSGDEASGRAEGEPVDPAAAAVAREGGDDEPAALVLRPMEDVEEAEDGEGHLVAGMHAVAFDLDSRLVPMRGDGDPLVLHVGDLVLERVRNPRPGIFRFILADRDRVQEGAAVTVQYGDDSSTEVVVDPVLHLPW